MEEFDSEDFSTSEEDEDYVPSGGEYSEDDVSELVKEDEVDGDEQTQKTKGKKRKAQSIPARKRKQGGLSFEEEEEENANEESGGSSSEEEDSAAEQEKGIGSEDARKKKEDELWASFLNDVGPKSKVPPSTHVKKGEETEETSSSKLLVKAEDLEKPKETEKVKITKVFDFAGEEVRVTKEVDATSKEAKSFFKQNEKEKPQANVPSALPSLAAGSGNACGMPKFLDLRHSSDSTTSLITGPPGNAEFFCLLETTGSPCCGSMETNPTSIHEDPGSIAGFAQWVKDLRVAVSCGVGCRHGLDPVLLWLWYKWAAVAPIRRPAWELLYALGSALKRKKKKKNNI